MMTPWHLIPDGSTVRGGDGYEWEVRSVGRADPGAPRGTVKVVMYRDGRGEIVGHPGAGTTVELISSPTPVQPERVAVAILRQTLGATVVECAWCSGDPTAECLCDASCGAKGCINF